MLMLAIGYSNLYLQGKNLIFLHFVEVKRNAQNAMIQTLKMGSSIINIMSRKVVIVFLLAVCAFSQNQMTYNDAAELAHININLPSTTFPFGSFEYIRLSNGVMVDHKGNYLAATLSPRIVNADFNNDTYTDAAVLLDVVHDAGDGVNYTTTHVFIVLLDYANGPRVSYNYPLAKSPSSKVDIFSSNEENNKIIIQYRQTRQDATNKPTVEIIPLVSMFIYPESRRTYNDSCYAF